MKNIYSAITILLAFCGLTANAQTDKWVDVTDSYMKNVSYQNESAEGWEYTGGSPGMHYDAMEFWNTTFNVWQSLNIPAGHYRLSVNAFYRIGENDNSYSQHLTGAEVIQAYLYAGETASAKLVSVYSEHLTYNYNGGCWNPWGSSTYFPNNMESASYCFGSGMYQNSLEFDVTEEGETKVGIYCDNWAQSNWTIYSNWKLEWYGTLVDVTGIKLAQSRAVLVSGQTYQIEAAVQPENATLKTLKYESSNTDVATVDDNGLVMAKANGTATIKVYSASNESVSANFIVVVRNGTLTGDAVIINEIMPMNIDRVVDNSYNYGSWIEIYNPTATAVSLTDCWLSDDPANLKMAKVSFPCALPPSGYATLYFDHSDWYTPNQVDMKLDMNGGTICISDANGKLLQSMTYPAAIARCSYARNTDGSEEWGWTEDYTPGETNNGARFATSRLAEPVVRESQVFNSSLVVNVPIPQGARLLYTTDCSTPWDGSETTEESEYGQFQVTETTVLRFCLVQDGYLPSKVVTRSFIKKDKEFSLPVISIVSDDYDLYSDEMGIFTQGKNGRPGNGQSGNCNWNMDWVRPGYFCYFADVNTDPVASFSQEIGLERCGGWSRAWTPYSFKIEAKKQYELQNTLPYQFFSEKPYLKHKTLQIRNGGNDNGCRIKDAALQEIILRSGLNVDGQAYQPVAHYINGKYMGVLNMREPNNKHFVYANYGLDENEIDQFEMSPDSGYVQKCGTYSSMQNWLNLSRNANIDATYQKVCDMVDIEEYCNYMATEFFLSSYDWPQNNIKGFRPIMENGKFRFVLFDLDGAFSLDNPFTNFEWKQNYTFDRLYGKAVSKYGSNITKEIEMVTIFLNMLQNEDFKKKFADSFCLVAGSVFEPSRVKSIVNELATRANDMQVMQNGYWNTTSPWGTANNIINTLTASYANNKVSYMKSYLGMGAGAKGSISSNISEASIRFNGMTIPTGNFNGTLFHPITLKAEAPAGYEFLGWKSQTGGGTTKSLFATGSQWKYYDNGSLDGTDWKSADYDDASWKSGNAPLGYGKNNIVTQVTTNLSCYYLRKDFTVSDELTGEETLTMPYTIDDGFVVYLNGAEVGRYNMPSGTITYDTGASSYAQGNPDSGTLTLDASKLKKGTNTIAVEIHNNQPSSSDIVWNASLSLTTSGESEYVCQDSVYTLDQNVTSLGLTAMWRKIPETSPLYAKLPPVVINEISAANGIYVNDYQKKDDWVELYNTTDEDIDLQGMYFSDKTKNPTKWQITAPAGVSTIIPAHGYKVIWCSQRDGITEIHAPFKLENEDHNLVRLMSEDKSWTDSLIYCVHEDNQTVGRYPDGASQTYVMSRTTILHQNEMTLLSKVVPDSISHPDDPEEKDVMRGDANNDSQVTMADVMYVVNDILGTPASDFNKKGADANLDGNITMSDVMYIVNYILTGFYPSADVNVAAFEKEFIEKYVNR